MKADESEEKIKELMEKFALLNEMIFANFGIDKMVSNGHWADEAALISFKGDFAALKREILQFGCEVARAMEKEKLNDI